MIRLLSVLLALMACGLVSPSRQNVLFVSTIGTRTCREIRDIPWTRLMGRKRGGGGGKQKGKEGPEAASNGGEENAVRL